MTDSQAAFDQNELAQKLFSLRREARKIPTAQFATLPGDLRYAMEVQKLLSKREAISSNAWKVAITPDKELVVAALHPYVDIASESEIPWRCGMRLEAEIAVRIGKDLPVTSDGAYSRSDIVESISEVHLGAELLWTGIEEGGKGSFLLFLADRLGNMGYVLGPPVPKSILDNSTGLILQASLNNRPIYDGTAQHPSGDVITWLLGYANDRLRSEKTLVAGMLFTTGSLCGTVELPESGEVEIRLGLGAALGFSLRPNNLAKREGGK